MLLGPKPEIPNPRLTRWFLGGKEIALPLLSLNVYLAQTNSSLNDPKKFSKVIKVCYGSQITNELPISISHVVWMTNQPYLIVLINILFLQLFLFESLSLHSNQPKVQEVLRAAICTHFWVTHLTLLLWMCLRLRALIQVDPGKSVGSDKLEPFFLRSALDFIAELPRYIFNLWLSSNEIPNV